jgi:hypothetical protein
LPSPVPEQLSSTIKILYRLRIGPRPRDARGLLGDLDLAEESMHEAFAAALDSWNLTGVPENPRPWLISTARFKAIDASQFHSACPIVAAATQNAVPVIVSHMLRPQIIIAHRHVLVIY